jgi:hypothetical protein
VLFIKVVVIIVEKRDGKRVDVMVRVDEKEVASVELVGPFSDADK